MPRIKDLTTKTGNLSSADQFVSDNGTAVTKIDYTALAKAIIEQYNGSTLAGSAQSVQAALNSLNSKLTSNTISTGSFKDIKQQGLYYVTNNVTDTPTGEAGLWRLQVDVYSGAVNQIANANGTRDFYFNTTSNNIWLGWVKLPTRAEMDAATAATTITQLRNTDLNTLTEPMRIYYAGGSHGCTNVPANAASFGLIVLQISSGYRAQICISSGLNVYIRRYASETWGSWFEFAKSAIS